MCRRLWVEWGVVNWFLKTTMAFNPKYDAEIMLAVFKQFLQYPPQYCLKTGDYAKQYCDSKFVNALPHFNSDLVRWHVAVLLDEFVLAQDIRFAVYGLMYPFGNHYSDYLNCSGQQFYVQLCHLFNVPP